MRACGAGGPLGALRALGTCCTRGARGTCSTSGALGTGGASRSGGALRPGCAGGTGGSRRALGAGGASKTRHTGDALNPLDTLGAGGASGPLGSLGTLDALHALGARGTGSPGFSRPALRTHGALGTLWAGHRAAGGILPARVAAATAVVWPVDIHKQASSHEDLGGRCPPLPEYADRPKGCQS